MAAEMSQISCRRPTNPVEIAPSARSSAGIPSSSTHPPPLIRTRRYKAAVACTTCRRRKLKCDGSRPVCGRCLKQPEARRQCSYSAASSQPLSGAASLDSTSTGAESAASPPANAATSDEAQTIQESQTQDDYNEYTPGPFARKVTAAINAQFGLGPSEHSQIPLLDAPLFGSPHSERQFETHICSTDNALPPRKLGDHLLHLYWRDIESIEPVLDQAPFYRSYHALYVGGDLEHSEPAFSSTLNVVFALATQLQKTIPYRQREKSSTTFFLRARALLQPDAIIWEPPTIEYVQCMLLMGRFLQCTNNNHQMWSVLGNAVRMAQSLGLHLPNTSSPGSNEWKGMELWHQCIYLHRSLSWSLGMLLPLSAEVAVPPGRPLSSYTPPVQVSVCLWKLDEITSHILLAQTATRSRIAEAYGMSGPSPGAIMSTAMHFEDKLAKLSASFESISPSTCDSMSRKKTLFRIRLAHSRILLFRPMLARLCFARINSKKTGEITSASLEGRVLQDCATHCVASTEELLSLVCNACGYGEGEGSLPWWYNVFYLFVVLQTLLAAFLRPDVFGATTQEHWEQAMSTLHAHEHMSPAVVRCASNLQNMYQRALGLCAATTEGQPQFDSLADFDYQAFFQQFPFDPQDPFLSAESMYWVDS